MINSSDVIGRYTATLALTTENIAVLSGLAGQSVVRRSPNARNLGFTDGRIESDSV